MELVYSMQPDVLVTQGVVDERDGKLYAKAYSLAGSIFVITINSYCTI
jgi:hypothetical protein